MSVYKVFMPKTWQLCTREYLTFNRPAIELMDLILPSADVVAVVTALALAEYKSVESGGGGGDVSTRGALEVGELPRHDDCSTARAILVSVDAQCSFSTTQAIR